MQKLALYNKSYHEDVLGTKDLLESIYKYNCDNLNIIVSCPKNDRALFINTLGTENYELVNDEDYCQLKYINGWASQTPIKLSAFKVLDSINYLILDSDTFFIKDFFTDDFIAYGDTPFTIIHDLKQSQEYGFKFFKKEWDKTEFAKAQLAHREIFDGPKTKKIYDYGPNPHLFSSKVLKSLFFDLLEKNNMDIESLYLQIKQSFPEIHPRETLIYNEFLLANKIIDIVPTGPFFKSYLWKEVYDYENKNGFTDINLIRQNYLGVCVQTKHTNINKSVYLQK